MHLYAGKAQPSARWIQRQTRRRIGILFPRPLSYVPLLVCVAAGFAMPFLEIIPFSGSIVASGVFLIALSFVTRDGLLALLSLLPFAGLATLAVRAL